MKQRFYVFLLFFIFTTMLRAQDPTISSTISAGFHLSQYQNDFGLGLNISSPFFAGNRIAVRLRGNFMFYQHVLDNETTWSPYSNVSLGVIGVGGMASDFIRLYGEGGIVVLFPSEEFSTQSSEMGGYGLFGFEFFMSQAFNYFIEIGGIGTGANADKLPNSPIYSNGLLINIGFRGHFR